MAETNAINKRTEDLLVNKASGDPFVNFQIGGTDEFVIGVDDDDADSLKINQGGTDPSSGTNVWKVTATGERTMPLQPAFLAFVNSTVVNVTGNGGIYKICDDNNTTVYDLNGDYDDDGVFTAPVTGKYDLKFFVIINNLTVAADQGNVEIVTSNRTYHCGATNPGAGRNALDQFGLTGSALADMDAGDTVEFRLTVGGEVGNTVGVLGNGTTLFSYICGYLEL